MSAGGNKAGLVVLGVGLGMALPIVLGTLPAPINMIQQYLWIILIVIGIILIIKD